MNTATTATAKVASLKQGNADIFAALCAAEAKGAAKGALLWETVAPLFSRTIVSGGELPELAGTTAKIFKIFHDPAQKGRIARAFRATAAAAVADFTASKRAATQDDHDTRLLALSAHWCMVFPDAKPPAKKEGPTLAQQLALCKGQLAQRDAELTSALLELAELRQAIDAAGLEIAPAPAPAPVKETAEQ